METVVQLRADIAALYANADMSQVKTGKADNPAKSALDAELARQGLSLRPTHPGTRDEGLMRYFTLVGAKGPAGTHILENLNKLEAVTAAYTKPGAEPA